MSLNERFLVFVLVVGPVFQSSVIEAYKKSKVRPYIVGGYDSKVEEHPYQVLLRINTPTMNYRCSGSIISEYQILTAGHCLHDRTAKDVELWYGITNASERDKAIKYSAKHIEIHPRYNFDKSDYDAALIWVDKKINLNNSTIKAIGYVDPSYDLKPDSEVTVSGWGKLSHNGDLSSKLQQVKVKVVKWKTCQNMFRKGFNVQVTPRMWCAGNLVKGGTDACTGDSGSAALQNGKIVGIVSWSRECALPNAPGVYTDIRKIQPWIEARKSVKL